MRLAGALVARILARIAEMARPGVTTADMNAVAEEMIAKAGAQALFRGVKTRQAKFPFPAALCTSVNEVVVHGIPSTRRLEEGDIVSVDCGVRLNGYCGDSAVTLRIGQVSHGVQRLLSVTQDALELAIGLIRPKTWWSDVAGRIQAHVEAAGFSVVREFVGHGIGREMHEEPKVPNYIDPRDRRQDFMLRSGMVLAVEPMVNMGAAAVVYGDATGWPVVTQDGSPAAHFEHTVAVTDGGVDILTLV
ncbi:MAG: type I methionyl aminopeptidase [Planctomycetes bacterium]|nr:type I methionyl aminopeptidase [Planctomycetota bacterium]